MDLQIADIVLVKGHLTSITDDAIKLGETLLDRTPFKSNYVHVALYLGSGLVIEAQMGRMTGYASFAQYADNCDIGRLNLTPVQRADIAEYAKTYLGTGYDLLLDAEIGIEAVTGIHDEHVHRNEVICSEFVYSVIHEISGKLTREKSTCTPEDLALDPDVTILHM